MIIVSFLTIFNFLTANNSFYFLYPFIHPFDFGEGSELSECVFSATFSWKR